MKLFTLHYLVLIAILAVVKVDAVEDTDRSALPEGSSKFEVRRPFAYFKTHKTGSSSVMERMCELFDCQKDVSALYDHTEDLGKADFIHSRWYREHPDMFKASKGFMGHVYNIRREKYRRNHTGKGFASFKKHREHRKTNRRFFKHFYNNAGVLYGSDVFVFTSLRDAVSHFVSSVRFFNTPVGSQTVVEKVDLEHFLHAAVEDTALHNPMADDFGLSTKADLEWFVDKYARSCKVFFIMLENMQESLDIA
eukprot:6256796-Pyramimonas_sp.AAC.1